MSAWAKPGVKCVCIDADPKGGIGHTLVHQSVYTIDGVFELRGTPGVWLVEVRSEHETGGFRLERFRPLITEADDLALFTHHLNTQHSHEDA